MKLSILNGSPRGKTSNSRRLVESWMFDESIAESTVYAKMVRKDPSQIERLYDADCYVCVFPLYVDSLPSIVKYCFELMEQNKEKFEGKKIAYVIHSGFPEPAQSRLVQRYVEYFTQLMDMQYLGTVVMSNSEGLQVAPDGFFGKKKKLFRAIGDSIRDGVAPEEEIVKQIAGREHLSKFVQVMMTLTNSSGFYWKDQLKKNNAYEDRLARPYQK